MSESFGAQARSKTVINMLPFEQASPESFVVLVNAPNGLEINREHFDEQLEKQAKYFADRVPTAPKRTSMLISGTQNIYSKVRARAAAPVMVVAEEEKTEKVKERKDLRWFQYIGNPESPVSKYFEGTFETKSGKPWYTP